jgi:hypothetical protein
MPVWLSFGEHDYFGGSSLMKESSDAKSTVEYWIGRDRAGKIEEPMTYSSGLFHHQVWVNASGVPMVRYSIMRGRKHNFSAQETWFFWDEFLCRFSRDSNGAIHYMRDPDVMR